MSVCTRHFLWAPTWTLSSWSWLLWVTEGYCIQVFVFQLISLHRHIFHIAWSSDSDMRCPASTVFNSFFTHQGHLLLEKISVILQHLAAVSCHAFLLVVVSLAHSIHWLNIVFMCTVLRDCVVFSFIYPFHEAFFTLVGITAGQSAGILPVFPMACLGLYAEPPDLCVVWIKLAVMMIYEKVEYVGHLSWIWSQN